MLADRTAFVRTENRSAEIRQELASLPPVHTPNVDRLTQIEIEIKNTQNKKIDTEQKLKAKTSEIEIEDIQERLKKKLKSP